MLPLFYWLGLNSLPLSRWLFGILLGHVKFINLLQKPAVIVTICQSFLCFLVFSFVYYEILCNEVFLYLWNMTLLLPTKMPNDVMKYCILKITTSLIVFNDASGKNQINNHWATLYTLLMFTLKKSFFIINGLKTIICKMWSFDNFYSLIIELALLYNKI